MKSKNTITAEDKAEAIMSLIGKVSTVGELASKHGVSEVEVENWRKQYRSTIAASFKEANPVLLQRLKRRPLAAGTLAASLILCSIVSINVWSDPTGTPLVCDTNTELFCFNANSPAKASEVNHNFTQLLTWIENKVGDVSESGVTALDKSNGNMVELTPSDPNSEVGIRGGNSAGNLHLESDDYGEMYLNWFTKNKTTIGGDLQVDGVMTAINPSNGNSVEIIPTDPNDANFEIGIRGGNSVGNLHLESQEAGDIYLNYYNKNDTHIGGDLATTGNSTVGGSMTVTGSLNAVGGLTHNGSPVVLDVHVCCVGVVNETCCPTGYLHVVGNLVNSDGAYCHVCKLMP